MVIEVLVWWGGGDGRWRLEPWAEGEWKEPKSHK
jgi:hypothetical protein